MPITVKTIRGKTILTDLTPAKIQTANCTLIGESGGP